jgi:hypothetical protein
MNVSKKLKRKMNRIVKDRFVSEYHCINMRDGIILRRFINAFLIGFTGISDYSFVCCVKTYDSGHRVLTL